MQKILIVDDDSTLRAALTRYLKDRGFIVRNAASGIEGLESFNQDPPDLIVSDVVMPEMNGFELCTKVRDTGPGQLVPFIFLSGRCDLEDRIQGHSIGADDYLVKPFHPRELIAKIEAQLARALRIHSEIEKALKRKAPQQLANVDRPPLPLTPAEEKVFWEVIQGFTNKKIGDRLFISPRTVQTHLSNILSKLALENRSQLIRYAFENGYQPPHSSNQISNGRGTTQKSAGSTAPNTTESAANQASENVNTKAEDQTPSKTTRQRRSTASAQSKRKRRS